MKNQLDELACRGVLEGFCGARWAHEDRISLLDKMPAWNMNLYIYSARNDPYHKHGWAVPYPREEMRRFEELAERAAKNKVMFSIAISPADTYDHSNREHRRLLMRKLQQFCDVGCKLFPIFYDDSNLPIDFNGSSGVAHAERQASVINYFLNELTDKVQQARVLTCPAEFGTSRKSEYLSRLHANLDRRVEVMCTNVDDPIPQAIPRKHCPNTWAKTFSNKGAELYFRNFGRKPFLWDNFNCADFALNQINWSPYQGRGDRLDGLCSGIVLNPQHIALINDPVFGTLGEYLANPRKYNPRKAMDRSLAASLGKDGAVVGRILSKWFTNEWTGYMSSDENLPDLKKSLSGTKIQRIRFLRQVKKEMSPMLLLKEKFDNTIMPPDWACHLDSYVRLLSAWACAMNSLCDAALVKTPVAPEQARSARNVLAELRGASNRMPDSLLDYLEEMGTALRFRIR